jgi:hypothetical protein
MEEEKKEERSLRQRERTYFFSAFCESRNLLREVRL